MKLRRLITRRRLKWAGLGATLAMALVFTASFYLESVIAESVVFRGGERITTKLQMRWGYVHFTHGSINGVRYRLFIAHVTQQPVQEPENGHQFLVFADDPMTIREALSLTKWLPVVRFANGGSTLVLPTWIPLVLSAFVTMWLWWVDRRVQPWECQKCRYDLRGLAGVVCPECGESKET